MNPFEDLLSAAVSEARQSLHVIKGEALKTWVIETEKLLADGSLLQSMKEALAKPISDLPAPIVTRLKPPELTALDTFIAGQDPHPTRPEAIRLALRDWLTGLGLLKHRDDPEGANGK
jgi:hypothetical protein